MVQVVENWAMLEGTVESVRPSGIRADLDAVDVSVDRVEPVEGLPNLLGEALDSVVSVVVPHDVVLQESLEPGTRVRMRARKASPFETFADPNGLTVL